MDFLQDIVDFISKYVALSDKELEVISCLYVVKNYNKDDIILREGERAHVCFFVLKGCVRSYYLINGEEKTTEFFTEKQAITPLSYVSGQPSAHFLSCTEDCVLALGNNNEELLRKVPRLETLIARFNGEMLTEKQQSFDFFKCSDAEQRYRKLVDERPDLVNRVPLRYLATYLGITPVSLSRIRQRMAQKKN